MSKILMYDKICYTLSHYCKWYMQLFQNGPVIVCHVPAVTHHLYYCSLKHTHLSFATSRSHEHLPVAHKLLVVVFVSLCHHNRNTSMKKGTQMVCDTKHVHMRFLLIISTDTTRLLWQWNLFQFLHYHLLLQHLHVQLTLSDKSALAVALQINTCSYLVS